MSSHLVPIGVGTASARAEHAADLGKIYTIEGKMYRVAKAGAAITVGSTGGLVVNTAVSSGVPTWVVTLATANSALVAGVIPAGQKDSAGAAGLKSGDYFLLQISGPAEILSGETIAANALVAAVSTAGKIGDSAATAGTGAIGVALEAASAADTATSCMLKGLH